ncbi:hypothetical protein BGZ73_002254 [Actinomortierella ambigua]|nr:hypothetical protein BGZ73_002254 [Actinomortierella ambigua]
MQKTILVTLALVAQAAQVAFGYSVFVTNKGGSTVELYIPNGRRICGCLKNTQSKTLRGVGAGQVKLFWSSDCTGNYNTMGSGGTLNSAYWVNSISFGKSGISSEGPYECPNYHAVRAAGAFALDSAQSAPEDKPQEQQ